MTHVIVFRGGSRTAATSKMELFVIIKIITKRSILDVAAVLDPPLVLYLKHGSENLIVALVDYANTTSLTLDLWKKSLNPLIPGGNKGSYILLDCFCIYGP